MLTDTELIIQENAFISIPLLSSREPSSRITLDVYIRTYKPLHTISTQRSKVYWRGLNPDKQINTVLGKGLSKERPEIDANLVHRKLPPPKKFTQP